MNFDRSGTLVERKFREYLLPTLLSTISVTLSNMVSSMVVGNLLGETALSAIGLSAPVIYLINSCFSLFAVGGMTCAAVAKGRRDEEAANRYFSVTLLFGVGVMTVLVLCILLGLSPIAGFLAQRNEGLSLLLRSYLGPLSLVGPASLLVLGISLFARVDGFPKTSAYIAIVANVVAMASSFILIKYGSMGIAGAGWAMVLGYLSGLLMLVPYWRSRKRGFSFRWPGSGALRALADIARTGLPKSLTQGYGLFRTLILNSLVLLTIGPLGVAALAVCINAQLFTSMFITGTSDTLLPIVGTLYGEKDWPGIRFAMRSGFRILLAACFCAFLLFEIAPDSIGRLFGMKTDEGLSVVRMALRLYALSLPLFGINTLLQNFYQTTGRVRLASMIATLEGFVCVVAFAFLLSRIAGDWIWLAFFLGEIATMAAVYWYGRRIAGKEGCGWPLLLSVDAEESAKYDATIPATPEAAAGLSERIVAFCVSHGLDAKVGNRAGLAVEEMAANTARFASEAARGKRTAAIDVLVRLDNEDIAIRIRDDGPPFDPTVYRSKEDECYITDGIELVKRLARKISYSRQLGLNNTVIVLTRKALDGGAE